MTPTGPGAAAPDATREVTGVRGLMARLFSRGGRRAVPALELAAVASHAAHLRHAAQGRAADERRWRYPRNGVLVPNWRERLVCPVCQKIG